MPEEVNEEVVKTPKRRGRKPKVLEEPKKITGDIDSSGFILAAGDIEKDLLVKANDVTDILIQTMEQAYLEWSYPGLFKDRDNPDPAKSLIRAKVVFDSDFSKFKIYDVKTVTLEDDIVDDAYQISPEDAKEYASYPQVGDKVEIPFDVSKLDKAYVRRVKQLFQSHLKDASKQAILSVYSDRIGQLIEGTVTRYDSNSRTYELSFGKAVGFLKRNNIIPQDKFLNQDRVLVYLSDVSEKSNPPSLVISRSSDKFMVKMFERAIPEVASGEIRIKAIAREAGRRTKVFVESRDKNIDPIGTCLGIESNRIRTILNEVHGEKIDVLRYESNKALQIIEAMKPAVVIGIACPEDFFDENVHFDEIERDPGYEFPHITVVVSNGNQGVAIGTGGVNVRLASQLTSCTISVLQADEAIHQGVKYLTVSEIIEQAKLWKERQDALDGKVGETPSVSQTASPAEEENTAEGVPAVSETVLEETAPVENEEQPVEGAVEETVSVPSEVETPEESAESDKALEESVSEEPETKKEEPARDESKLAPKADSTTTEMKEKPIEHVEIRNKPKISLSDLEEALSQKKGPSETRSRKRYNKFRSDDHAPAKDEPSKASTATAMPIYTDEELKAMAEQDEMMEENDYDSYDEELEQYDYYEDDEDKKRN